MNTELIPPNLPLLPPEEVRIESVRATLYPDRRRVRVEVDLTPFHERPNLEIVLRDAGGQVVSSASAVSVMHFRLAFTLHLREGGDPTPGYHTIVTLYYDDLQSPQDSYQAPLTDTPNGAP
ncbi:MAG: hypothetical protein ACUVSU_15465 [Aggregatilineaceae bacterium]